MNLIYELEENHPKNDKMAAILSIAMRNIPDLQVFIKGKIMGYGTWADAFKELRSAHSKFGFGSKYAIEATGQFHWQVQEIYGD